PLTLRHEDRLLHFPDLRSLTHELKALGAHNLNPGRPDGLTGRQRIRALAADPAPRGPAPAFPRPAQPDPRTQGAGRAQPQP
ncbi:malonyl-[acyl-carrier protein] O-methyltransferase BioC, partial [Pseudomonas aeruginosa]